jgi:uncharacterized protein (TIGR03083 family)
MTSTGLWPLVQQERLRFADLLATLSPDDWASPSLAAGWSVKDVAAHCIATAHTTPVSFVTRFAGAGFNFTKFNEKNISRYGAGTPDALVAETRATAGRTSAPPGPPQVPISEIVVHSEGVARPLGRPWTAPPRRWSRASTSTRAPSRWSAPRSGPRDCTWWPPTWVGSTGPGRPSPDRRSPCCSRCRVAGPAWTT